MVEGLDAFEISIESRTTSIPPDTFSMTFQFA